MVNCLTDLLAKEETDRQTDRDRQEINGNVNKMKSHLPASTRLILK